MRSVVKLRPCHLIETRSVNICAYVCIIVKTITTKLEWKLDFHWLTANGNFSFLGIFPNKCLPENFIYMRINLIFSRVKSLERKFKSKEFDLFLNPCYIVHWFIIYFQIKFSTPTSDEGSLHLNRAFIKLDPSTALKVWQSRDFTVCLQFCGYLSDSLCVWPDRCYQQRKRKGKKMVPGQRMIRNEPIISIHPFNLPFPLFIAVLILLIIGAPRRRCEFEIHFYGISHRQKKVQRFSQLLTRFTLKYLSSGSWSNPCLNSITLLLIRM